MQSVMMQQPHQVLKGKCTHQKVYSLSLKMPRTSKEGAKAIVNTAICLFWVSPPVIALIRTIEVRSLPEIIRSDFTQPAIRNIRS